MKKQPIFDERGKLVSSLDQTKIIEAFEKPIIANGLKSVAISLGMSEQYLRRITNPNPDPDELRHMRLDHALQSMEIHGDLSPLHEIARQFNHVLAPLEEVNNTFNEDTAYAVMADVQISLGSALDTLKSALEDKVLTKTELSELFEKLYDLNTTVANARGGVQGAINEVTNER